MDSRPTVVLQDVASKEERILPLYEVEEEEGQAYGHLDWDSVTKGFNASQVEIEGTGVPAVFRSGSQEGLTIDWFHSGTIVDKSGLRAGNWIHSGTVIKVNIEKQAAMPQLFSFQDHFKKLLKQASVNQPDSKVIDAIARHLPAHMMAAGSPTRALDLYERGKLIPGVSTQEQLLVQHQIRVGGPYFLQ